MASSLFSSKADPKDIIHIDGVGDIEVRTSNRAKHLRLAVSRNRGAYVVKPRRASRVTAHRFVVKHEQWLKKHIPMASDRLIIRDGDKFSFSKSLSVTTDKNASQVSTSETVDKLIIALPVGTKLEDPQAQEATMKEIIKIWRAEAKKYLPKRLEMIAKKHKLSFNDVRVKYMHSRWGSCSSRNNINLNIQLMRLEPELIDHVLTHELCHTRHHNHSKAFWSLFESLEPDARQMSKKLRQYSLF